MPIRLKLIYLLCCFIDALAFTFHQKWLIPFGALPVICLLILYVLRCKGIFKPRDYTYIFGLVASAVADITFEFRTMTAKVIAMVLYVFTFSFYTTIIRKEAIFTASSKELLKMILHLLLILSPFFFVFSKIPTDYFFSSIIYMVFLSLLNINALLRQTNKSSYWWFLAGALAFVSVSVTDIYFAFVINVPHSDLINKILYQFAQYAIFIGVIKANKNPSAF